jgi:flagellar protein FlaG
MEKVQLSQESIAKAALPYQSGSAVKNDGAAAVAKVARIKSEPDASVVDESRDLRVAAERAAQQIENFVASMSRSVKLTRDDATNYIVVQLVNPETGELIRTLPS